MIFNLSTVTESVFLSTHRSIPEDTIPSNIVVKPDVKEIKATSVVFVDDSEVFIDVILYCTGYNYSYPFLSVETGICRKGPHHIYPLYKHCINIEHPTMALIGLIIRIYGISVFDMQVHIFNFR